MAGRLRARSLGPIGCLYLVMAVSAWFLLPYRVVLCHPMRPSSAMSGEPLGSMSGEPLGSTSWMRQSRGLWLLPFSSELGTAEARGGTMTVGQHVRCDLAGSGVHGKVELAPPAAQPAVLLGVPLALAEQL